MGNSKKLLLHKIKIFMGVLLLLAGQSDASRDTLVVYGKNMFKSAVGVWGDFKKSDRPVAVWFHGGMSSAKCDKGLVAGADLGEMLSDYVVISASACGKDHWVLPEAAGIVDAALDSVALRRKGDVGEVYLVGVSDGALGVMAYSMWGKRKARARLLISSYGAMLGEASMVAEGLLHKGGRWRFLQGGADRLYPAGVTVPWIESFCGSVGQASGPQNRPSSCDLKFDAAGEHDWSYWKSRHKDWILEVFQ